jgi:RNA polymerase-binding transcription factor
MSALKASQLTELKNHLDELQQQLEAFLNLDEAAAETVELDQGKVGRLSRMDALQQQAMAQASSEAHKQQLVQVHRAQHRIEEGHYGYCEECGKTIPFARLQVQPEADFCVDCLQALEGTG